MSTPIPPHLQGTPPPPRRTPTRSQVRAHQNRTRAAQVRENIRVTVRGFGEILITFGLVLLLFCGYQLWWTDVTSNAATKTETNSLQQQFAAAPKTTDGKIPPLAKPPLGQPFALMYVPRFGKTWVKPIIQGTELVDLHKGVGHYDKSSMPGEVGNFAVAGHRTTNGHPFRNIDKMEVGDKVFVETKDAWYTYVAYETNLVVGPTTGYWVVSPTGTKDASAAPTQKIMTMTSCHPPYSASERMVTHLKLESATPRGDGPPAGVPTGAI